VGTWGPGAFDNDDALDLLDTLNRQDAAARRQALEQIFRTTRKHPQDLNWALRPAEVVAAAAVVAASLPADEAVAREITGRHYDVAALVIPDCDPELADAALAALLIAAWRDGAWHQGGPMRGRHGRPAGRLTSSPRSSTATSTGTTRNCPWNPGDCRVRPAVAEKGCIRRIPTCPRTGTDHAT
jgi:hypothetical protein